MKNDRPEPLEYARLNLPRPGRVQGWWWWIIPLIIFVVGIVMYVFALLVITHVIR